MKGYLIYTKKEADRNQWFIDQLIQGARRHSVHLSLLIDEDIIPVVSQEGFKVSCRGEYLDTPDFVIARSQNYILSRHFELMGVRVFNNSRVSRICNDKMLTYQLAASLGIRTPETHLISCKSCDAPDALPLAYPCVIKPTNGKGGQDVYLLENGDDYSSVEDRFENREFLCQTLACDKGRDTRFYVMGKEILCAFTRVSDSDFRSNFCLGGQAIPHTPSEYELSAVRLLADALDFDFVGIDFIYDKGQPVFNEIEDAVGSRMVYANTDIDVAEQYIKHILSSF